MSTYGRRTAQIRVYWIAMDGALRSENQVTPDMTTLIGSPGLTRKNSKSCSSNIWNKSVSALGPGLMNYWIDITDEIGTLGKCNTLFKYLFFWIFLKTKNKQIFFSRDAYILSSANFVSIHVHSWIHMVAFFYKIKCQSLLVLFFAFTFLSSGGCNCYYYNSMLSIFLL